MKDLAKRLGGLHQKIVDSVPALQSGKCHCTNCGNEIAVDAAECLRKGWPKCCGATMYLGTARIEAEEMLNGEGK